MRKNNFYKNVEFIDSGAVVAQTLHEITFKLHVCNIFWQFSELKYLKKSHSRITKIQSSYFGHEPFIVFTAACYMKCSLSVVHDLNLTVDKDTGLNNTCCYNFKSNIIWRNIAICCNNQLINFLKIIKPEITKRHFWSDEWCGQFRSLYFFH